ncbi:MAG: hypothetical protein MMC23_001353 [Stictis urceolatum]|nr:hypothetical protein [Stictis urceolata]
MTGILSSIENLVSSIFSTIQGLLNAILSSFQGVFAVFGTIVANIADLARGLVELVLGNIVIIGVAIAALVGYSAYAQRRGQISQGSTLRAKKSS